MTYADSMALIQAEGFAGRVSLAVLKAAIDISHEAADDEHPDVTAKRFALAQTMMWGGKAEVFIRACAINPTISAAGVEAPDGDIDFVVASTWNAIAGVTPADLV